MPEFENWATSPRAITLDESLTFESAILRKACESWRALSNGAVPLRSQISARAVKDFVGHLVIFERLPEDISIRLMGTRVAAVLGEMQGKLLREALPHEAAQRWSVAIEKVLASQQPLRIVTLVNINDLQFLEAESFLAPLGDATGAVTMTLAAVVFRSGVAKSNAVNDLVGKR